MIDEALEQKLIVVLRPVLPNVDVRRKNNFVAQLYNSLNENTYVSLVQVDYFVNQWVSKWWMFCQAIILKSNVSFGLGAAIRRVSHEQQLWAVRDGHPAGQPMIAAIDLMAAKSPK